MKHEMSSSASHTLIFEKIPFNEHSSEYNGIQDKNAQQENLVNKNDKLDKSSAFVPKIMVTCKKKTDSFPK